MARITVEGKDYVTLTEDNLEDEKSKHNSKVHLIELNFSKPTEELFKKVLDYFPDTRRFVISNFIRFYNSQFKKCKDKKFYVKNLPKDNLLIFFKRNNKVLLDITVLRENEKQIILSDLDLILNYIEVVKINQVDYNKNEKIFKKWRGNVIIEG